MSTKATATARLTFATALFGMGVAELLLAQPGRGLGVESYIYVGTRTSGASDAKGMYLFRMRTSDDPNIPEFVTVTPLGVVAETANPTFFEIDAKRRLLFCVNELGTADGKESGSVSAFAINSANGRLTPLGTQSTGGPGPCHLALDRESRFILVANAANGSVAVLPVSDDGRLGEATDVKRHTASGNDADRSVVPRPVGVAFSPDNRFAFVCDLGLDKIMAYKFDAEAGKLTPHEPAFTAAKPGAGPRHMVFRPDGKFAYVVNERNSTVTAYAYDAQAGTLKELQSIATLPEYYDGPNLAMEIGVHPSGKNLLVSNCGHHSIVLFTIDAAKGTLTYVEDQSTYGTMPIHFGIDTDGKHVVVANQESGNILILRGTRECPRETRWQRNEDAFSDVRQISAEFKQISPEQLTGGEFRAPPITTPVAPKQSE